MDLLEQGADREPLTSRWRPPRWARGALVVMGVLAALAVAVTEGRALLPGDGSRPSPTPPPLPTRPLSLYPAPSGAFGGDEYLVVAGPAGVRRLSLQAVREGRREPVERLTGDTTMLGRGGIVPLVNGGAVVLLAVERRWEVGRPGRVVLADAAGGLRFVGHASALRPSADGAAAWVEIRDRTGVSVSRVSPDDAPRSPGSPTVLRLPPDVTLAGETDRGLVVAVAGERPGPVRLLDRRTGRTLRTLATRAVVLDVDAARVVLAACAERCPPRVHYTGDGWTMALDLGGAPGASVARLSPDGRHVAAALPQPGGSFDVVVTHLLRPAPWRRSITVRTGLRPTPAGRPPILAYGHSGWLVVSDGRTATAVAPGPHPTFALPADLPPHEEVAVLRLGP